MKTVLRDIDGNIYIHYFENKYLEISDYKIVEETEITVGMVKKAFNNLDYLVKEISNGTYSPKQLKVVIMNKNEFNINFKVI